MNGSPRFHSLLRVALEKSGLTQREFAKKSGFSQGFPPLLLAGKRTPPLDKLDLMADALGLSGQLRQEFMDAAHAAHSSEHLVAEHRQRGQEIDRLRLLLDDVLRYVSEPEDGTDAAAEEAAIRKYTRDQAIERLIQALRFNRKIIFQMSKSDRRWLIEYERAHGRV